MWSRKHELRPYAAANGGIALWLQSPRLVAAAAELALGRRYEMEVSEKFIGNTDFRICY